MVYKYKENGLEAKAKSRRTLAGFNDRGLIMAQPYSWTLYNH